MAFDPIKNFAVGTITTGYDIDDVTIVLASGHGAYFPDPATEGAYNLVWWNSTDYKNPSLDPLKEIVRVTGKTSDTLTVTRPAIGNLYNGEGSENVAHAHNITGRQYKFMLTPTKKYMADFQVELNNRLPAVTVGFADAKYICDGTSDEVQIQQAIDEVVASGGGWVYILPGTYDIRAKLDFSGDNVKLVGAGQNATILKLNAAFTGFALIYDFTASMTNIEITGITFDANNIDGKGCIELGQISHLNIHDNEFKNVAHVAGNHWTVRIGTINDLDIPGSASEYVVFENNYVHDNNNGSNETVLPINVKNSRFDNNYFLNNTNSAFTLNLFGYCYNTTVNGNVFRNSRECIYLLNCDTISVIGNVNYCEGLSQGIVTISNCQFVNVADNVSHGYRSGGSGTGGIRVVDRQGTFDGHANLYSYSRYITIDNNIIHDSYYGITVANGNGIFAQYQCSDITIQNNKIWATEYQPIHIGQNISTMDISNIVIKGNYCGIGNFFDHGAIAIIGYSSDVTKVRKITIQGNKILPTARSNGAGIEIDACSEIMILDNDMVSTGKGTFAGQDLYIVNAATYLTVKNNYGVNPEKIYEQGNVTGATTFNRVNGRVITATLTGNITTTMTAGKVKGDELTLILTQDGTGSRTMTTPANVKAANGGTIVLSVGVAAVDSLTFVWDGTNWVEKSRAISEAKASGAEVDTGTNDTKFVTPKAMADSGYATEAYAQSLFAANDALLYKGVIDCSGNPNYPAADAGHLYKISVAGKIGGASGIVVQVGDNVLCTVDGSASGDQAAVGANWDIIQANIDFATGSDVDTGTDTAKAVTAKAIRDSGVLNTTVVAEISAVTGKTTPVDADVTLIEDSAASFAKKSVTWANIKATLKTYFDGLYLSLTGGTLTGKLVESVSVLTDGATPALNAALGNIFTLVAAGDRTIAVPTNPTNGQKILIRHNASGGARTLALNTGAGGFRFGTSVTGLTITASGKTDYIACVYNSDASFWDVVGYSKDI